MTAPTELDLLIAERILAYSVHTGGLVRTEPGGPLRPCPAFSSDRNATADAEQRVRHAGFGQTYADHLLAVVRTETCWHTSWEVWLYATPIQRCQALLLTAQQL
ncbi:hypothetical protein [Deinococcus soli (ex Cha et al. 2016)]|uniref:Uncharacterized protein n=2 Tax=Deinococcus soli (ex Cha et al. 2016) TaxID=1309411 RepID=A0ACC6KHM1_9DEIO|nr:hypothetical protein [Deinococcus soli (ex Cha et al. 2016)]MDR6218756.1 hypothetical protein [Deinococcus soli (ex Cha et al. 2016)]MDR6328553.1 hypothetical protein [Deinococcus soli (ex Cha et al. 2016)]MDR6751960.1 hypothetical protein [Deinococcus soli (ex Cha et al. 2016)]